MNRISNLSIRRFPAANFATCMAVLGAVIGGGFPLLALAQDDTSRFHNAPPSVDDVRNPFSTQANAADAGRALYAAHCAACHGSSAQGGGNVPPLTGTKVKKASPGALFWFISQGDINNGMPAWNTLPEQQRWNLVSFVQSLGTASNAPRAPAATASMTPGNWPKPKAPFTDFRYESPGTSRKIVVADLPAPYATASAGNAPQLVARPADAWPKAPAGFKVELFANGLDNPRLLRTAPNGDVFVAETRAGRITLFRGMTADGHPKETHVFASGLDKPFGIAFYPAGPHPQWIYIGNTDEVVRLPYKNGDLQAQTKPEHVADLPHGSSGHSTRDVNFSPDGKRMYVSVGSASNVDDSDTSPGEKHRADILVFRPDGSDMQVYAYGIRNAVGLAIDPKTGELWCSVNERDGLGDNLVPDVLLNPHDASLQLMFYTGEQFPAEYRGDIFASEHGSWNRSARVGYEVIRVPRHGGNSASGDYQDFLTGFVLPSGQVWGRPVGVTAASDGSLLVSDDGSNSIWRVSYQGP